MRFADRLALALLFPVVATGCSVLDKTGVSFSTDANSSSGMGGGSQGASSVVSNAPSAVLSGPFAPAVNVMPVSVDGSQCDLTNIDEYFNEPCTSVTICQPGTSNCQTINNILVDTGSYGLRVFSSVLQISLSQESNGQGSLAECATFGIGADWGPVEVADVVMGNVSLNGGERASSIPVQVINSSYADLAANPSWCNGGQVDVAPSVPNNSNGSPGAGGAGFNGILGVGVAAQDCGQGCVTAANNSMYFACSGNSCQETTAALTQQVANPVAMLPPPDNNGVILWFPSVPQGGVGSLEGQMLLGIGTESNNFPAGATTLGADPNYYVFLTSFNNTTPAAILDSGSNALYFDDSSLTPCPGGSPAFYCPTSETQLSGVLEPINGYPPFVQGDFFVGDAATFGNFMVFSDVAAQGGGTNQMFIWGIPFFYGKTISVGIEGTQSVLGSGPYWAL